MLCLLVGVLELVGFPGGKPGEEGGIGVEFGAQLVAEGGIAGKGFLQLGDGKGQDGSRGVGTEKVGCGRAGYFVALLQAGIAIEEEAGGIQDAVGSIFIKTGIDAFAVAVAEDGRRGRLCGGCLRRGRHPANYTEQCNKK